MATTAELLPELSMVSGPQPSPLWFKTIGSLIEEQAQQYRDNVAVSFPWQGVRLTYHELAQRSRIVARSLSRLGLHKGDCVGIMAGNCYQYIETFLGSGRAGCPVAVLNNTYSPKELLRAIKICRCRVLCISASIGKKSLEEHIRLVRDNDAELQYIVLFSGSFESNGTARIVSYNDFTSRGTSVAGDEAALMQREASVQPDDLLNLQFTSGTTGDPKAAMLTHINLINNGRFVADRMQLTPHDIVCCPPPLFHCFGLVMGFLGAFTHGSSIVFPSDQFDADRVLDAIAAEKCTALLGVPTMFVAELEAKQKKPYKINTVRTGLAAGSPVPHVVVEHLEAEMGITGMLIAYGMTETSPVTFMTALEDSHERRLKSIGTVMPHTRAKIIDQHGHVVPRGVRGEICTSGYALQKGYWQNEEKTREVMKVDENGIVWMHTGDEGMIDSEGYCSVTGRIKDIIIRGGENIFPAEIEERLLEHPSINEASVVGMPNDKYGEVVSCFLHQSPSCPGRPSSAEVQNWVKQAMGSHKVPKYVWWIGDPGVGQTFPKTGSGKYQKHILKEIGHRLLKSQRALAKL